MIKICETSALQQLHQMWYNYSNSASTFVNEYICNGINKKGHHKRPVVIMTGLMPPPRVIVLGAGLLQLKKSCI